MSSVGKYRGSEATGREDGESALVLTHPFDRFGTEEEELVRKLEEQEFYDEVYYIGTREGHVPPPVQTTEYDDNRRSVLPPGHGQELYDGVLEEVDGGSPRSEDIKEVLQEYDFIGIGGASKGLCTANTRETLNRELDDTELRMDEEFLYSL